MFSLRTNSASACWRRAVSVSGAVAAILGIWALILGRAALPAAESLTEAQLLRAKDATCFVEIRENNVLIATGSAFCIDGKGLYITNNHVIAAAEISPEVWLVAHSGTPAETRFPASVVKTDPARDLCVLSAERQPTIAVLPLAQNPDLKETQTVFALGFPLGRAKSVRPDLNPPITVTAGTVTALRRKDGKLDTVQFNASVTHGNSGGPLIDKNGAVIGVVVAGFDENDVNSAIFVESLSTFVSVPTIKLRPAAIDRANLGGDWAVHCTVQSILMPPDQLTLRLTFPGAAAAPAVTELHPAADGGCKATVRLPAPSALPADLVADLEFPTFTITGRLADRPLAVDGRQIALKDTVLVVPQAPARMVLATGATIEGAIGGLDVINVQVGPNLLPVDLRTATTIKVHPSDPTDTLAWQIQVLKADQLITTVSGRLPVQADVNAPAPGTEGGHSISGCNPPPAALGHIDRAPVKDGFVLQLPDTCVQIAPAAGGRYLILQMEHSGNLKLFDCSTAKLLGSLDLNDAAAIWCAGSDCVMVYHPDSQCLERWDLATRSVVRQTTLPPNLGIAALVMGSDSAGPMLTACVQSDDSQPILQLMDTQNFKVLDSQNPCSLDTHSPLHNAAKRPRIYQFEATASADGSLFAVRFTSPGVQIIRTADGLSASKVYNDLNVLPAFNADGTLAYCREGTVRHPDMTNLPQRMPQGVLTVPAQRGPFHLSVNTGGNWELSVFRAGDTTPLGFSKIAGLESQRRSVLRRLSVNDHFHLIPDAQLVVILSFDRRFLFVQPIDLSDWLSKAADRAPDRP